MERLPAKAVARLPQGPPSASPRNLGGETPGTALGRTPRNLDKTPRDRWRRAVARICAQKAVVEAFEPEPYWKQLRPYVSLLTGGLLFAPISQTILVTSVCATSASGLPIGIQAPFAARALTWWWPTIWWRGLGSLFCRLWQPGGLMRFFRSTALFALHDTVTRGRTQWVEQATEAGAVRKSQPLWKCVASEAFCGLVGARMLLEYMRSTLGGTGGPSWRFLLLGTAAGAARGAIVASGGQHPKLQTACNWSEFMLEVIAERESACLLGFACPLPRYVAVVLCGICNFLPWGMLVTPCNRAITRIFGEDPVAAQKAALERVALELEQSQRGQNELASARERVVDYIGNVELASLWHKVRESRGGRELVRVASGPWELFRTASGQLLDPGDAAQKHLDMLLARIALQRSEDLQNLLVEEGGGHVSEDAVAELLEDATAPIIVRRSEMVRSALTQIAERSVEHLLLGVTAKEVPGLQDNSLTRLLGLRVQFVGEEGVDMGGVRKDFMDCFAAALTRPEAAPLSLVEPVCILGLGADSTWRPAPCDEEHQSFLWAFGRLLALALVYRCPCPVPMSCLVFKCLLGTPLRPGDVRQLDPDFWHHRVKPLLEEGGAELRQKELREWCMDPLVFTSADGGRELKEGGADILVTEGNRKEYAQLLCEDFLIGSVRTEIGCLVMGFHEVVPQELIKDLDAEQLRMLVCGVAEIDVDDWEAHAVVDGVPHVAAWFFDWLRKKPQETRSKMLAFATGSSVLPSGWDGLKDQQGQPLPFRILAQGDPEALPSAHTCANLLVLPPVASRAVLERRLDRVVELAGREMLLV